MITFSAMDRELIEKYAKTEAMKDEIPTCLHYEAIIGALEAEIAQLRWQFRRLHDVYLEAAKLTILIDEIEDEERPNKTNQLRQSRQS